MLFRSLAGLPPIKRGSSAAIYTRVANTIYTRGSEVAPVRAASPATRTSAVWRAARPVRVSGFFDADATRARGRGHTSPAAGLTAARPENHVLGCSALAARVSHSHLRSCSQAARMKRRQPRSTASSSPTEPLRSDHSSTGPMVLGRSTSLCSQLPHHLRLLRQQVENPQNLFSASSIPTFATTLPKSRPADPATLPPLAARLACELQVRAA